MVDLRPLFQHGIGGPLHPGAELVIDLVEVPLLVDDAAVRIADREYDRAGLAEESRRVAARVAETLDRDPCAVDAVAARHHAADQRTLAGVQAAAGSRLGPAERSADLKRLAGHD